MCHPWRQAWSLVPLVSHGNCSSHAQRLPWGAEEGKAEISSSNIHAVSTQFIRGRKKGVVVKSLVSETLASASATLQSQASHAKPWGLL